MKSKKQSINVQTLVLAGVMTAIVIVLQAIAIVTRTFLPAFSINLVLMPIVVGAAIGGVGVGHGLGSCPD